MRQKGWLVAATFLFCNAALAAPVGERGDAIEWKGKLRVHARLVADHGKVTAGDALRVGVLFTLDPGWHIYWINSGQAGLPTKLAWTAPHMTLGEQRWPGPSVEREGKGDEAVSTYGWTEEVLLARRAKVKADAKDSVVVAVKARFLACEHTCIPGSIELRKTIPIAAQSERSADAKRFARYDDLVPRAPNADGFSFESARSASALRPEESITVAFGLRCAKGKRCPPLRAPAKAHHAFIPDKIEALEVRRVTVVAHPAGDGVVVRVEAKAGEKPLGKAQRLSGVLQLVGSKGRRYYRVVAQIPRAAAAAKVDPRQHALLGTASAAKPATPDATPKPAASQNKAPLVPTVTLWQALLFAFLGGMLLNLMPCVFPVLALKVYGITTMLQHGRGHIARHGLAYCIGVLLSMLALGGVILGLRAAGTQVGWGFQFQSPLFVAILASLLVAFALNLFGVFEVGLWATRLGQKTEGQSGLRRSFSEGALAVALATPCSAPFVGTAIGFAFSAPAIYTLSVFCAMGLGLALPFVLVSLVPGLGRLLPKPGAWMVRMKQVLGFALLATVVWLSWILGQTQGVDGVIKLLAFLAAVGFACWLYGTGQMKTKRRAVVTLALSLGILVGCGIYFLEFDASTGKASAGKVALANKGPIRWRPFDKKAIAATLQGGRVAFVDFTADWCLTCKWNERTVLRKKKVLQRVAACQVEMYKADWTARDERIRAELARFGKAGVPLYLVYSPKRPAKPQVLPELISVDGVLAALDAAQSPSAQSRCVAKAN